MDDFALVTNRPRIAVFIDGANLNATTKILEFSLDFKKLRTFFEGKGDLLRIYFYTALLEEEDGNIKLQRLVDFLAYNGVSTITKIAKEYISGDKRRIKGNMDVEFTLDVYKLARTGRVDHVYLFTGDGDFRRLVQEVQEIGIKVTIVSSMETRPVPMVADILRKQADAFLELNTLRDILSDTGK
jgi:uncharacterized LabA/DUF88 family protein